ncbi:hypothetical protein ACN28E_40475 [Archangium lansingense]|uniref:hypothetical protein n=1 Tax=Archangium lansingense TaxID=2995310 RepID=UPI003B7AFAA1
MSEKFSSAFDVPAGTHLRTPFNPELEEDFVGLRIGVPPVVEFRPGDVSATEAAFTYIPVSLTYRFNVAYVIRFENIELNMAVMAVNAQTGKSYSGILEQRDVAPRQHGLEGVPRARLERLFTTSYHTFDLAEILPLPQEEATYHIHMSLETHQSNVVTVSLRKRK